MFYAEQINNMLQRYHFNCEDNPQGQDSHYAVLASGIQHLYGLAFCASDNNVLKSLRPVIDSICDGDVSRPL